MHLHRKIIARLPGQQHHPAERIVHRTRLREVARLSIWAAIEPAAFGARVGITCSAADLVTLCGVSGAVVNGNKRCITDLQHLRQAPSARLADLVRHNQVLVHLFVTGRVQVLVMVEITPISLRAVARLEPCHTRLLVSAEGIFLVVRHLCRCECDEALVSGGECYYGCVLRRAVDGL